ncbi:hypothetical protein ABLT40_17430, partial [Acinetobacter schindleri]
GIRSPTYPSYALNLAQLGALCISNLCATKPFKCINNIKLNKCNRLRLISSQTMLNKYNFINPQDGMSVLLKGEKDFFLIVSPFFDEEGANLRIMKVKDFNLISEKYIYAGKNVEIDNNLNIKYFEGNNRPLS